MTMNRAVLIFNVIPFIVYLIASFFNIYCRWYKGYVQISLKKYKKDFEYSYASGVFATLELLYNRPGDVIRVFINSKGGENKGIPEIRKLCLQHRIPVEVADGLVIKLSNSENCYAVGVFKKYSSALEKDKNHVLLVNPSDMGNLGTIIRTMVGFGIENLAVVTPAADLFDPKVIRSSTGAFFHLKFDFYKDLAGYTRAFPGNSLYVFMLGGTVSLDKVVFKEPFTLVFGNEGSGLDIEYLKVGTSVFIPHTKNIDSLNLSMAAGIAMYIASQKKGL